ncbi:MAG: NAD(P)-dependent oxidoreductase [Candidatus Limnocylindrales bacterium]
MTRRRWTSGGARPVVGFIGLGRMGSPMAMNIARAGFELVVFDVRGEAVEPLVAIGARVAESAPGLAAEVDIIVTMLPGPPQVEAVMLGAGGAFQALREGSIWIDMSTSTPVAGRIAAEDGARRGVGVVDAPVAGMVKGATAGTLQVFVGGDPADVERILPVLRAMGDPEKVVHVGAHGAGYAVKLCLNLLWFIHAAASAEVLVLGAKAGVEVGTLRRALTGGPASSALLERDIDGVFDGDYDESFTLDLVTKDLGLAVDLGRDVGVPLELSALVEQLHRRARGLYGDRAGELSSVRMVEEAAGIKLRLGEPAPPWVAAAARATAAEARATRATARRKAGA